MHRLGIAASLLAALAFAQPAPTLKQLMLDLIHPASNDILFFVNRGAPAGEKDWAAVRRAALTLAESGRLLTQPGLSRDSADWRKDAQALAGVGTAAYKAALARDSAGLAALADPLDNSCTACHKQFRPNVFPRPGGSQ